MARILNNIITCLKVGACVLGGVGTILTLVAVPVAAPIALLALGVVFGVTEYIIEDYAQQHDGHHESCSQVQNVYRDSSDITENPRNCTHGAINANSKEQTLDTPLVGDGADSDSAL